MAKIRTNTDAVAYKINERLFNILIALLGVILILMGVFIFEGNDSPWETVFVSIGTSLLAGAVVSYMSSIYVLKRLEEKEIADQWGLRQICSTRSSMNEIIQNRLESKTNHLDIIAYGLKSLRDSKTKLIKAKVKNGTEIRIITVRPDCNLLNQKDIDESKVDGSTKKSIQELCRWVNELKRIPNAKVTIKFCNALPTEVYFRVDDYIFTGPYQIGRESQHTITQEYQNPGEGFLYYKEYFDQLWDNVDFCAEDTRFLNS